MAGQRPQQPLKTHRAITIQTMRVMGSIDWCRNLQCTELMVATKVTINERFFGNLSFYT
jgi:hypothetical protein